MRISCLRPDLFPVREAILETLFHMLRNETIFISRTPFLQTFRHYRH